MAIRAVVLDIGGVLEIVDDDVFPAPAERRLGLAPGSIAGGLAGLPGDAAGSGLADAAGGTGDEDDAWRSIVGRHASRYPRGGIVRRPRRPR